MAKLRRSASRPSPVKKARAASPAARAKARPAVKKSAAKPSKAAPKKPPLKKPAAKPAAAAKPAPRPVAKAPAASAARTAPKAGVKAPAPPPRRSTYADAVLLYERGLQALQAKRYKDAADTLKRVIAEFPEEIELHERAQLYIRVCERHLTPPDATPKTAEEQVYAATLALNTGNVDRAIALATAALQRDAENDAAEYLLAVALATKDDDRAAMPHLARALELNPDIRDAIFKEPELEPLRATDELQALLAAAASAPRREKRAQARAKR
jgi:tetratricopeptide (TPR) repeat protein